VKHSWRFLDWTARFAHIAAQFQWEPRGLWVGVFWDFHRRNPLGTGWDRHHGPISGFPWSLHVYICIVPTLPLHVYVQRMLRPTLASEVEPSA
jgi:hypothetical protein